MIHGGYDEYMAQQKLHSTMTNVVWAYTVVGDGAVVSVIPCD